MTDLLKTKDKDVKEAKEGKKPVEEKGLDDSVGDDDVLELESQEKEKFPVPKKSSNYVRTGEDYGRW